MLMAPSLSIYYVDHLRLIHSQVVTGRSIFMGIGIVLSSYFWQKALTHTKVAALSSRILIGFGLFPLTLMLAKVQVEWLYIAFIFYGVAQAGSHLLWNLSGTLFAKEAEDSSQFSRVNILMVGLRGIVAPALGGVLCLLLGPFTTISLGAIVCFSGAIYMIQNPLPSKAF